MDPRARSQARIYPSLVRPVLIGGLERNAAGLLVMAVLMLLFGFRLNWLSPAVALLLVTVLVPALRRATRRDGQFLEVYRRHVLGAGIYEGQPSHLVARSREVRSF